MKILIKAISYLPTFAALIIVAAVGDVMLRWIVGNYVKEEFYFGKFILFMAASISLITFYLATSFILVSLIHVSTDELRQLEDD